MLLTPSCYLSRWLRGGLGSGSAIVPRALQQVPSPLSKEGVGLGGLQHRDSPGTGIGLCPLSAGGIGPPCSG